MKITGAQIIIEVLLEQGIDTIFGYPGGSILHIYNALYDSQDRIRHILTADETGAAHAADGFAGPPAGRAWCWPHPARGRPIWSPASPRHTWIRCLWWPSPATCPPS